MRLCTHGRECVCEYAKGVSIETPIPVGDLSLLLDLVDRTFKRSSSHPLVILSTRASMTSRVLRKG